MTRRRWTVAGAAVALGLALGAAALVSGLARQPEVPLFTVEERPFVRRVVAEGHLETSDATPLSVPSEVWGGVRIAWLIPDGSAVAAGDVVARLDPTELERMLADAASDRAAADWKLVKELAEGEAGTRNLERDAEIASLELGHAESFQKGDPQLFSRHEIVESELDEGLARERRDHAEAEKGIRSRLRASEKQLIAVERRRADIRIDRAERGLGLLEIRAPHPGFVVLVRDWRGSVPRVGDTVWRGQKIAEIPDLSVFQAEVFALEADAGGLDSGDPATVGVESRPGSALRGRVARVDAVAKPRVPGSPVQYFGVTLELEGPVPAGMKPGQRVRAEIVLESEEAVLLVPRVAVVEVDGRPSVHRWRGAAFEAVPVVIGALTPAWAVVEGGLAAGDRIALRDPAREPARERSAADGGERLGARLGQAP